MENAGRLSDSLKTIEEIEEALKVAGAQDIKTYSLVNNYGFR